MSSPCGKCCRSATSSSKTTTVTASGRNKNHFVKAGLLKPGLFRCAVHGIYLDGESPSWGLSSQWSTTSRTPRVSSVRKNLKEGEDKTAAWRKETASEAGKSRMSVQHNTKSNWLRNTLTGKCGRYAVKEIWPYPGRSHEWLICHSNNESWEVSRAHSSEEVYVMYMERRGESVWSFK
jgi:hypothetical protein